MRGGGDWFPLMLVLLLLAAGLHWGSRWFRNRQQHRNVPFEDGVDYRKN